MHTHIHTSTHLAFVCATIWPSKYALWCALLWFLSHALFLLFSAPQNAQPFSDLALNFLSSHRYSTHSWFALVWCFSLTFSCHDNNTKALMLNCEYVSSKTHTHCPCGILSSFPTVMAYWITPCANFPISCFHSRTRFCLAANWLVLLPLFLLVGWPHH